jgi:tripeptide aminopeptidase
MESLLDRFCRYVKVDTQSKESAATYPSSPGQLELGRMLTQELRALGARDADIDSHGIVLATVPATVTRKTATTRRSSLEASRNPAWGDSRLLHLR